jgi:hypothetical protein
MGSVIRQFHFQQIERSTMCTVAREIAIRDVVTESNQRAWRESITCILGVVGVAWAIQHVEVGSTRHYACLVLLVSIGFIAGIVWAFSITRGMLESHPADDERFWNAAFRSQATLLRYAPLWYATPICVAVLLFAVPGNSGSEGVAISIAAAIATIGVFTLVTYLNRKCAARLDRDALLFVQTAG